jgi:hypothetical protein
MTASLNDLRAALDDAARSFAPSSEVTLRNVEHRVAAADRRRRVVVSGVVAALVMTGGGLFVAEQRGRDNGALMPGHMRTIVDDPSLPVSYRGMLRISLTEWRMTSGRPVTIALPDVQDRALYARAICTGTEVTTPILIVTNDGLRRYLPCVDRGGVAPLPADQAPSDSVELGHGPGTLTVEARGANAVGTARIAIYVRAGASVRPPEMDADSRFAWTGSLVPQVFGPPPTAPNSPLTVKGTTEKNLLVTLVVRGVGTLRVTANGRTLAFQCHNDPDNILGCAQTPGPFAVVHATDYGPPAQVYFSLDNWFRTGESVTVSVTPSGFSGDDWRLDIFDWTETTGPYPPSGAWTVK